jgi:hypothetical protein
MDRTTASNVNGTTPDVLSQVSGVMESRDVARLAALEQTASLLALEKTAMQAESDRLAAKYGKDSQQAQDAAGRMAAQAQQQAAVASDLLRASTPIPAPEQGTFVVYGRVIDAQGKGVTGAKIVAAGTSGSSLASTSTKSQGSFELRVPLASKRKASIKTDKGSTEESTVNFQLVVSAKSLDRPYTSPEVLTAVSERVAYREIGLPDTTQTAGKG